MAEVNVEVIKRFRKLPTSVVSDALDRLGIAGACLGIKPIIPGVKAVGPAYTVRYTPMGVVGGTVGDYIDEVPRGYVVVLDNRGRTDCTVWGGILSYVAKKRGIEGTVIDGVCRDVDDILRLRYPVFSRGFFMRTGKGRVRMDAVNVPVTVGGVLVRPGDMIVADSSGVVVVPRERAEEVLSIAEEVHEAEENIVRAVDEGLSLGEARKKYRYHKLSLKG